MIAEVENDETLIQLRRAILEQPEEDTPRLMFADRLDEIPAADAWCYACKGRGSIVVFGGPGATNAHHLTCRTCNGEGVSLDDAHLTYAAFIRLQVELSTFPDKEPPQVYGDIDRLEDGRAFLNCWQPAGQIHAPSWLEGKLVKLLTKSPPHSGLVLGFLVHRASFQVPEGDEMAYRKARLGITSMGNLFITGEIVRDPWWVRHCEVEQKQHLMATCRVADSWVSRLPGEWQPNSEPPWRRGNVHRRYSFRRGFVDYVEMQCDGFMTDAQLIFAYQPVTTVSLSDRDPLHERELFTWQAWGPAFASSWRTPEYIIPSRLMEQMFLAGLIRSPSRTEWSYDFSSRTSAQLALSSACVGLGRKEAGLPCLTQTTPP